MELSILRPVSWNSVQRWHLAELLKLEKAAWDGTRAEDWLTDFRQGMSQMWDADQDGSRGLLLTRVETATKRELVVDGLAGVGMIRRKWDVLADLKKIAKQYNCQVIGGHALPKGLRRLYASMGLKDVSVHYVTEL